MKRGAIFDMDGTLFDTEKFYVKAWTELADFFGVERIPTLGIEMSGMNREQALLVLAKYYPKLDGQKYFDKVIETVSAWMETDEMTALSAFHERRFFYAKNTNVCANELVVYWTHYSF